MVIPVVTDPGEVAQVDLGYAGKMYGTESVLSSSLGLGVRDVVGSQPPR